MQSGVSEGNLSSGTTFSAFGLLVAQSAFINYAGDIMEYIARLINALIAMIVAMTSSLVPGTPEYLQKFGGHCPQVTENRASVMGNYVINPSFEDESKQNAFPEHWLDGKYNIKETDMVDCTTAHTGKCSFYFSPHSAGPNEYVRRIVQVVPYRGSAGTRITFSGWSKARNVHDVYPPLAGPLYGVGIELFDNNGESIIMPIDWDYRLYSADFSAVDHDFEYAESSFLSPVDFTCAEFYFFFDEAGEIWVDDAQVTFIRPDSQ